MKGESSASAEYARGPDHTGDSRSSLLRCTAEGETLRVRSLGEAEKAAAEQGLGCFELPKVGPGEAHAER